MTVGAIQVFTVGAGAALLRGLWRLQHPEPGEHYLINYAVLGISALFEGSSWLFAIREFSRTKGRLTYVQAVRFGKDPSRFMALFEDTSALLGLVIAAAGIAAQQLTGAPLYDGLASILIGLVLSATAVWLAHETKGLLVGESANREVVEDVRRIALEIPPNERVLEVLSMHRATIYPRRPQAGTRRGPGVPTRHRPAGSPSAPRASAHQARIRARAQTERPRRLTLRRPAVVKNWTAIRSRQAPHLLQH